MPRFKKEILPAGQYLVSTADGKKVPKEFDPTYLATVVANSNAMIKAGLKVPAPFQHLKEAVPVTEEVSEDAYANAGYWDNFYMEGDSLWGEIDAPGSETDTNTPAGKITNTVQEVSACVKDSWTDGLGREWGPSILHGAPVLHPVVPGQKGFELMEDAIALSISGMMADPSQSDIAGLSKDLEDAGIYLPPETLLEDLPKVLTISLRQRTILKSTELDDEEIVESRSVFMSLSEEATMPLTEKEATYMLSLGAINPKTAKPFVKEDFEIKDDPRDSYNLALTKALVSDKKEGLKQRVEALVETKRTTKEFAETKLYPQIDTYQLSIGNKGELSQGPAELLIESLESVPVPAQEGGKTPEELEAGKVTLSLTEEVHKPEDKEGEVDAEEVNKIADEMLSMLS